MTTSDQQIIAHWALGPLHSMRSPGSGTIHRTLLFTTSTGSYFLRAYRYQEREPVAREHALIAAVCARGLPAIAPIPRPSGETILEEQGHYYAVFPHAPGVQVLPGHLTAEHVAAMGGFLARLHEVLQDYPPEAVSQRSFRLNRAQTLAQISRLEALIRARTPRTAQDEAVLTQLALIPPIAPSPRGICRRPQLEPPVVCGRCFGIGRSIYRSHGYLLRSISKKTMFSFSSVKR